jgi:hypothetical protein
MCFRVIKVFTRNEFNDFVNLPSAIYKGDKNWIPPIKSEVKRILNAKKNPYFKDAELILFNCYKSTEIRARICLIINKSYCEKQKIRTAFFGFFESYNDQDSSRHLFNEVFGFCRQNGIEKIEGPFNPNHYSELGMLCSGYDSPPSFFQTYNPEFYHQLLKCSGFGISKILHTRINRNCSKYLYEKYGSELPLEYDNLKVRSFSKKNFKEDLEHLREIFNDAFSENWRFLPVSSEEYLFSAKYLDLVTPPELIQFVEYQGKPAAAIHFALNINPLLKKFNGRAGLIKYLNFMRERKKIGDIIIFAVGEKKTFRNSKITQLLFNAAVNTARKFSILQTTWMYDDNRTVISLAEKLGLKRDKEFIIYSKNL